MRLLDTALKTVSVTALVRRSGRSCKTDGLMAVALMCMLDG